MERVANNDSEYLDEKFFSKTVGLCILSTMENVFNSKMVRTAASIKGIKLATVNEKPGEAIEALQLLSQILDKMGISSNLKSIPQEPINKVAAIQKTDSANHQVSIASKSIKDSHYFINVSKDNIVKNGKSMAMVCFFMREGYLGRYLIKRNFYYLPNNTDDANDTYEELVRKSEKIKSRYLSEKIETYDILPEMKATLDSIKGDFESGDDSLGTPISRDKDNGHEMNGPHYSKMELNQIRNTIVPVGKTNSFDTSNIMFPSHNALQIRFL